MAKYKEITKHFINKNEFNDLDYDHALKALCDAIKFKTDSPKGDGSCDVQAFQAMHGSFAENFPLVHSTLKKEVINQCSLIYHWEGSDSSGKKPVVFMSHLDAVPVNEGTESDWTYPPFSGKVVDGTIWGRGSIDTKSQVVGVLAAAEYLLSQGYSPKRDIYLCFGHDEESMGTQGAKAIMETLKARGIELEFVFDEAGGFREGAQYGVSGKYIAEIPVFEKGYADITVTAHSKGGHSSAPGKGTSLGRVAKAIGKIEDAKFEPVLCEPLKVFYSELASHISDGEFAALAADVYENEQQLTNYLANNEQLEPHVRTTTCVNMITGGSPQANVQPHTVTATINFRLSSGETTDDVLQHCIKVADDPQCEIKLIKGMNPSKISKHKSLGFSLMKSAIEKYYSDVVVVPSIVVGGTDAVYFEDICDCCYRFRPFLDTAEMSKTCHSTDEHMSVDAYKHGIKMIVEVMKNID